MSVIQDRSTLKGYFKTGYYPTEEQFALLIDSLRHMNDRIPASLIDGLTALLNDKADADVIEQILEQLDEAGVVKSITADGIMTDINDRQWQLTPYVERLAAPVIADPVDVTKTDYPNAGSGTGIVQIAISCSDSAATIKYKIGSGATQTYTAPFKYSTVGAGATITAWAEKDGEKSDEVMKATGAIAKVQNGDVEWGDVQTATLSYNGLANLAADVGTYQPTLTVTQKKTIHYVNAADSVTYPNITPSNKVFSGDCNASTGALTVEANAAESVQTFSCGVTFDATAGKTGSASATPRQNAASIVFGSPTTPVDCNAHASQRVSITKHGAYTDLSAETESDMFANVAVSGTALTYDVVKNDSYGSLTGVITVKYKIGGVDKSHVVTVVQNAAPAPALIGKLELSSTPGDIMAAVKAAVEDGAVTVVSSVETHNPSGHVNHYDIGSDGFNFSFLFFLLPERFTGKMMSCNGITADNTFTAFADDYDVIDGSVLTLSDGRKYKVYGQGTNTRADALDVHFSYYVS